MIQWIFVDCGKFDLCMCQLLELSETPGLQEITLLNELPNAGNGQHADCDQGLEWMKYQWMRRLAVKTHATSRH